MRKLYFALFAIILSNVGFSQGNVSFQADIANRNGDVIYIKDNKNVTIKEIKVDKKGIFSDKFDVKDGFYVLFDGQEYAQLFLKPGFDLKLKMDAKLFDETLSYTGTGSGENNFLAKQSISNEVFGSENFEKDKDAFYQAFDAKKKADFEKLEKGDFDANFKTQVKKDMIQEFFGMQMEYKSSQSLKSVVGKASPTFEYENHAGGKTKLLDLAGKYVYIDVWATWCGPCRGEIPYLQKIEEKYKGKNIQFVSISVDEDKDHEKWKKFVTDKALGGIQLFADKNWMSSFIQAFGINSIPRFILIDPKGNVLSADAERPSDDKLSVKLDELLK
jgi:thiol-disulfide isomerase/thioredoxin